MTKPLTVKDHAASIALAVAQGEERRVAYSKVVRDNDLTMGECAALRAHVDSAIEDRLRVLTKQAAIKPEDLDKVHSAIEALFTGIQQIQAEQPARQLVSPAAAKHCQGLLDLLKNATAPR